MTNFIYDNTTLPFKDDLGTLPLGADPSKWVRAIDWNAVCEGLIDVQAFCRGASWLGMQAHGSDPAPTGVANYLWLHSNGTLMKTIGGVAGSVGTLDDNAVTNAKLAQMPAGTLKGNNAGGTANAADLTAAQARTLLGLATIATTGSASDLGSGTLPAARLPALTGDVTSSAGSAATAIGANKVLNTMLAQMAAGTLKGNNGGGAANAADLTGTQVTAMLDAFTTLLKGLVPAPGSVTGKVLTDGGWSAGAAGGYKGTWAAGTYQAGSIVRRGPFTFGCSGSTSVDPCDVSDCGSATDWTLLNVGANNNTAQGSGVLQLTGNNVNNEAVAYRQATLSTWDNKRIIADVLSGPSGGATGLFIGVFDSSLPQTATSDAMKVGQYGVFLDNFNGGSGSAVQVVDNGSRGSSVTGMDAAQITGNEIAETSRFYRYYVDFVSSGTNVVITLWKDCFDLNTTAGINKPGFMATWTITKPSYTTCRLSVAAYTGGIAGTHRVRNVFAVDRSGAWDMLAMFPHAPRVDTSLWG